MELAEGNSTYDIFQLITGGDAGLDPMITHNVHAANTDGESDGLLPRVISECALYTGRQDICSTPDIIADVSKSLGVTGNTSVEIIENAKKSTGCDTERCVVERAHIPESRIVAVFKIDGPRDSALLSNFNIDETLEQWKLKWKDFYPYNFNMKNYASYSIVRGRVLHSPDTLATIKVADLNNEGIRCCGCVINSDVYQGGGKHWMSLFADWRTSPATVEFFNSSGNPPAPEWMNWLTKTKSALEGLGLTVAPIVTSRLRHQASKSECGLYSLYYIYARLNGVPPEYFQKVVVSDKKMFEFRQHLFNDPKFKDMKVFKFDDYQRVVKIKWESDSRTGITIDQGKHNRE